MNQPNYVEEHSIKRVLEGWGLQRDTCRWDELRACYTADATMVTTWFDGLASDFVEASIRASASPTLVQHFFGPSRVDIHGAHAIAESRVVLLVRTELEGVEVDITVHGRFFDMLRNIDGQWRIQSRMPIYEKDEVSPVDPQKKLLLDGERLNRYPKAYRHLAYVQELGGATITTRIPGHNSPEQRQLYAAGQQWLNGY